ncbi:MAG: hypothetical protein HWE27_01165 [Gammaproteobacteria bacterium]|nr:hypothetical protein [Gammaproteobacteria bacterium]
MKKSLLVGILIGIAIFASLLGYFWQPTSLWEWVTFSSLIMIALVVFFINTLSSIVASINEAFSKEEEFIFDFATHFLNQNTFGPVKALLEQINLKLKDADTEMISIRNSVARLRPMSEAVRDSQMQFEQSAIINQGRNDNVFQGIKAIRRSNDEVTRDIQSAFDSIVEEKQLVDDSQKVIDRAVQSIRSLVDNVKDAEEKISQLKNASEQIDDIIQVISSIADQTNLLALNAAIEAARAGESGRGFAVVADEVRQLAKRTHDSTQEVRGKIEHIQTLTQESYKSTQMGASFSEQAVSETQTTYEYLNKIAKALETVSATADRMKKSSDEERQATLSMVKSIEELVEFNHQALENSRESTLSADDLINLSKYIMEKLNKFNVSDTTLDITLRGTTRRLESKTDNDIELF